MSDINREAKVCGLQPLCFIGSLFERCSAFHRLYSYKQSRRTYVRACVSTCPFYCIHTLCVCAHTGRGIITVETRAARLSN